LRELEVLLDVLVVVLCPLGYFDVVAQVKQLGTHLWIYCMNKFRD
jgi:hypothetical protein